MSEEEQKFPEIPDEFQRIIKDFVNDITTTFPEYELIINKWWKPQSFDNISDESEKEKSINDDVQKKILFVFNHCIAVFPERFFDILYQNTEIFEKDSDVNTEFLPGISFKYLWNCDISDKTKETIWKYLQLILLSIIGCVKDQTAFGNTAKLFESINEDEFKGKLQETLEKMQNIFDSSSTSGESSSQKEDGSNDEDGKTNQEGLNMPSAEDIHNHISGMLGGKLGDLAREIAEETAENLNLDMENVTDVKDVFQKLFKNPGKLMNLVKNVGDKLDSRIKSGEINQTELMAEASDIMSKMKNMPGMENIQSMLGKMGMGGGIPGMGNLGKNVKLNTGAMQSQMDKMMKMEKMKERMKKKSEMKNQNTNTNSSINTPRMNEEQIQAFLDSCDKPERTPRNSNQSSSQQSSSQQQSSVSKKKKKNKK